MSYTSPGGDKSQALWQQTDIDILVAAINDTYVVSGCEVTAQGTPDMTLAVSAGTVVVANTAVAVSGGNVTIDTADGTYPRIDLVWVASDGTKTVTAGTAAANPKPPSRPAGAVCAAVYVPQTDTAIGADQITDKRVIVAPTLTVGDLPYANTTSTFARLADVAVGRYLRSGGTGTAPLWSTLVLPNGATTGDILAATSSNTVGVIGAGTSGYVLTANGAGAASTYQDSAASTQVLTNKTFNAESTGNVLAYPRTVWMPAAGCANTTAGPIWDLPTTTPAVAACVTGTNIQKGVLDFADTGPFVAQNTYMLGADWTSTGGVDATILWTSTATTGDAIWNLQFVCTPVAGTTADDPAFPTAGNNGHNPVTTTVSGTANAVNSSIITAATLPTSCATATAVLLHLRLSRDGTATGDTLGATARLIGVKLTYRRAI